MKTQNSQNVLNRSKIKFECTMGLGEYARTFFVSSRRILHTLGTLIVLNNNFVFFRVQSQRFNVLILSIATEVGFYRTKL